MARRRRKKEKTVEALTHEDAARSNIPPAEYQDALDEELSSPIRVAYERRNPDLDPQLVWRGKEVVNPADLVVSAPPLFIQEKVHPKVLIDDLLRRSRAAERDSASELDEQFDLFADFNGLSEEASATEFYRHEANWTNRMILGDSLHVMASLAEREGLRGKVQCIYIDPPYGIKFNSNFQWSTTTRDVKDGKREHITRDPEMVKAFRDTWRDGIHSYFTYLRDRLTVARDLLTESGCIFIQISDENVHHVRELMDEVFGSENRLGTIVFRTTTLQSGDFLPPTSDYLLWYGKSKPKAKFRQIFLPRQGYGWVNYNFALVPGIVHRRMTADESSGVLPMPPGSRIYRRSPLTSTSKSESTASPTRYEGRVYSPGKRGWSTSVKGLENLKKANRLEAYGETLSYRRFADDFPCFPLSDTWIDTATGGYADAKNYVVQTNTKVIQRCILMATDPGDLVLDPTCGSGTTATLAEQWGRRWITIDTSRVALALARARIMGARYPWYQLADSPEGQEQLAEITGKPLASTATSGSVRHGFVYKRVPHIMLKDIANNAEIDVIWERQEGLQPLREQLSEAVGVAWIEALRGETKPDVELPAVIQEWEVPRDFPHDWPQAAEALHQEFWQRRIERQKEIDESIARNAEFEYLYDQPYEDNSKVRVAGPFTVESLSPHREVPLDEDDRPMLGDAGDAEHADFAEVILEHLKSAGVQQAHKENKIEFSSLSPWPGKLVCAEGRYQEGGSNDETSPQRRAAIFIGPEFGSVMRQDLVDATEEAGDAGFNVLIACAFAYGPHAADISGLGGLPILKARMNADLHMSKELADTGKGNLFVIFGEPDIEILDVESEESDQVIQVQINGVDVFKPQTGKVVSDNRDGIACWMIDTDYNGQSFFVRHAYFLGQNDPYKSLKTSLKAEINKEAWATLNSPVSRPFPKPDSGRIAVKVINHLGDEVMKVYRVE